MNCVKNGKLVPLKKNCNHKKCGNWKKISDAWISASTVCSSIITKTKPNFSFSLAESSVIKGSTIVSNGRVVNLADYFDTTKKMTIYRGKTGNGIIVDSFDYDYAIFIDSDGDITGRPVRYGEIIRFKSDVVLGQESSLGKILDDIINYASKIITPCPEHKMKGLHFGKNPDPKNTGSWGSWSFRDCGCYVPGLSEELGWLGVIAALRYGLKLLLKSRLLKQKLKEFTEAQNYINLWNKLRNYIDEIEDELQFGKDDYVLWTSGPVPPANLPEDQIRNWMKLSPEDQKRFVEMWELVNGNLKNRFKPSDEYTRKLYSALDEYLVEVGEGNANLIRAGELWDNFDEVVDNMEKVAKNSSIPYLLDPDLLGEIRSEIAIIKQQFLNICVSAGGFFLAIITIIELLDIIVDKNCTSGPDYCPGLCGVQAELNLDTCLCDVCPPGNTLCPASVINGYDDRCNTCIDACCGGSVFTAGTFSCTCSCPEGKIFKACDVHCTPVRTCNGTGDVRSEGVCTEDKSKNGCTWDYNTCTWNCPCENCLSTGSSTICYQGDQVTYTP